MSIKCIIFQLLRTSIIFVQKYFRKGSSMAFVFRSQKKPIFQDQIMNKEIVPQPILNQTNVGQKQMDPSKIAKGLTCNKQKLIKIAEQIEQVKGLPQFQIKTIHKNYPGTLKKIFSLDKTVSYEEKEEKENSKIFNQIVQSKHSAKLMKSSLFFSFTKKIQKNNSHVEQKTVQKDLKVETEMPRVQNSKSEPYIVNKNLLKTLSSLKSKSNASQDIQQLGIISDKSLKTAIGQRSTKGLNFHSLKKLSPIKSIIKQNVNQESINLLLSKEKFSQHQKTQVKPQKNESLKLQQWQKYQEDENQEDQEDQEYDEDATPGPGAYNFENCNSKKQFRSNKQKFKKIFYSSLERFQNSLKFNEVTLVNEQKEPQKEEKDKGNKYISFLSNSPRFDKEKQSIIPPPGYYNTRETLQYSLIKNILKSSNSNTFINAQPRQPIAKIKDQLPGPGAYNVDNSIEKIVQQHGVPTFAYKSRLPRNLQYESVQKEKKPIFHDSIIEKDENKDFKPIHVQNSSMFAADYEIQVPPFLSNSERFPALKPVCKDSLGKIVPQLQNKKQMNRQAFNSSQKRQMQNRIGEGVGVGLYNLLAKESWNKKSHNVLFG